MPQLRIRYTTQYNIIICHLFRLSPARSLQPAYFRALSLILITLFFWLVNFLYSSFSSQEFVFLREYAYLSLHSKERLCWLPIEVTLIDLWHHLVEVLYPRDRLQKGLIIWFYISKIQNWSAISRHVLCYSSQGWRETWPVCSLATFKVLMNCMGRQYEFPHQIFWSSSSIYISEFSSRHWWVEVGTIIILG